VRKKGLCSLFVTVPRELFASVTESEESGREEMPVAPLKSMREDGELNGVSFNAAKGG
jgi:hypothetical protein